jgi:hypothetical protein
VILDGSRRCVEDYSKHTQMNNVEVDYSLWIIIAKDDD